MSQYLHIPKQGYGFPSLTASGDQFEAYVDALAAYTADNSDVAVYDTGWDPTNGVDPTVLEAPNQTWHTTYLWQSAALNPNGIVAYAPYNASYFMFQDTTNSDAITLMDHPTYPLTSKTHWVSTTRKFVAVWHNAAEVWCYLPDYPAVGATYDGNSTWTTLDVISAGYSGSFLKRFGQAWNYDNCVFGATYTNQIVMCRIKSDLTISIAYLSNIAASSPKLNVAMGPGGKALHFGLDEIVEIDISNEVNGTWTPTTTVVKSRGTSSWYEATDALCKPILRGDGCFYVFPSSRATYDANVHTTDEQRAIKYDPATNTVTQIDFYDTAVVNGASYLSNSTGQQAAAWRPSANGGWNACLMPDGRIALSAIYGPACYSPNHNNGAGQWIDVNHGPLIWNPSTGVFDQVTRTPWGTIPAQWGLQRTPFIFPNGQIGIAPMRMVYPFTGATYSCWASRFGGVPDVAPPTEFLCSGYNSTLHNT